MHPRLAQTVQKCRRVIVLPIDKVYRIVFRQTGKQRKSSLPPFFVAGRRHVSGTGDQIRFLLFDEPDQRCVVPPKARAVQVGQLDNGDVVFHLAAGQRHFGGGQRKGAEPP